MTKPAVKGGNGHAETGQEARPEGGRKAGSAQARKPHSRDVARRKGGHGSGDPAMATQPNDTTPEWYDAFIAVLRESANVRAACEAVSISRQTAYRHRSENDEFRERWDQAIEDACDVLEAAARMRALRMSDTLLIFLLKCHRPNVYRDVSRHEISGQGGAAVQVEIIEVVRPEKQPDDH